MFSLKITTRCHSVFSFRSPLVLSRQLSEVATLRLTTGSPDPIRRISGSLPRLPTRITLFTLPAMALSYAVPRPDPPQDCFPQAALPSKCHLDGLHVHCMFARAPASRCI